MQHIGKALKNFIQSSGLEKVLDQQKLIDDLVHFKMYQVSTVLKIRA